MFTIVRYVAWFIIGLLAILVCIKFPYKLVKIISGIIAVILLIVAMIVPFENLVVSFSSPEEALNYTNPKAKVLFSVDGEDTTFVVGKISEGKYTDLIVPKKNDRWKVGMSLYVQRNHYVAVGGFSATVKGYKGSTDKYISISVYEKIESLSDNRNSEFMSPDSNLGMYHFNAFVKDFDDDYRLYINGQEYLLADYEL